MDEVAFPAGPDGRRGSTAAGRAVVAAALRPVDPDGAAAAERATDWRREYGPHFRRLVEAGLDSRADWLAIARAGLGAMDERLRYGDDPLPAALTAPAGRTLPTGEVTGTAAPAELALPYRGEVLRGDAVRRQVDAWIAGGIAEPSLTGPVDAVLNHPEWLRLDGWTVVTLGAGAEMGPLPSLLDWGATVAAVDLPRPELWDRLRGTAAAGAGRLLTPGDGADLLADLPALADWVAGLPGRLVIGTYAYADGGRHVLLSAAADALVRRVRAQRPDTALAYLATPTDVFAVPAEAVAHAAAGWDTRGPVRKMLGAATGGRVAHRAYPPGADPGINDSLVAQQGANYALAKRIQRWRAAVTRAEGGTVSFHVAPSTRTRSVTSNRALAAAYRGAHRFGVEVFEPPTSTTLLAALLVHDLSTEPAPRSHPWQDEAHTAVHGGLWRTPYAPRSVLPIAALQGALRRR